MQNNAMMTLRAGASVLLVSAMASAALAQSQGADLLIRGGTIYDGSEGNKGFIGDVAISGDKIVYVGRHATVTAKRTIDAKGMVVTPGFIDGHTHSNRFLEDSDPQVRQVQPWLMQGVTTVLIGVDGRGTPEIKDEFDKFRTQGIGVNVASYVGYGTIRERVIGPDARPPTAVELASEKELVVKGMCEGAMGLSAGLFYFPQSFAKTDEIIELGKEAGKRGGIYDTHQRDEGTYSIGLLNSVKEAIEIGKETGMPVHFSHIKALGHEVWGKSADVIKLIDEARANGQSVTANQYPYLALHTGLEAALVPRWAMDGGYPAMIKRFNEPATLAKIQKEMQDNLDRQNGPHTILFTLPLGQPWTNKHLDEIAAIWKVSPIDAAIRILRQTDKQSIIGFDMQQADADAFTKQTWTVTGSDGTDGHPREYGTYQNKYQNYVKKRHVIDIGFFVRHSSGLAADIYMLDHRGYLKAGYYADVLVFDPNRYIDKADFLNWNVLSEGVADLVINGKLAVDGGKMTAVLSGRPLPHTPTQGSCL